MLDLNEIQDTLRHISGYAAGKVLQYDATSGRLKWTQQAGLTSTDPGALGPTLELYHNSASPAVSDIEYVIFYFNDASGTKTQAGAIGAILRETTAGAMSSIAFVQAIDDGTLRNVYFSPDENAFYPNDDAHWDLGIATTNRFRALYLSSIVSAGGAINTGVGYTVSGVAPAGNVLRGNGTNFVSSTLATTDLVGTWQTYSPTVTQSGTVTSFTTTSARYIYLNTHMVQVDVLLIVNNAGGATAANKVTVSLPVTAVNAVNVLPIGVANIYDASLGLMHHGLATIDTVTTVGFYATNSTFNGYLGTDAFVAALATGDYVTFSATYEV